MLFVMVKVSDNSHNSNKSFILFAKIFGSIDSTDYTLLTNILGEKFNLSFDSKGYCVEKDSIKIYQNKKNGEWYVNEFGSSNLGINNKNTFGILYDFWDGSNNTQIAPTKAAYTPTTSTQPKQNKTPCNAVFYPIEDNKAMLDYLISKTGATLDTLHRYDIKAVSRSYGLARLNSFAYATENNGCRIKSPLEGKFKYTGDFSKDYLFGYSQAMAAEKVNTIIFVGGEDDALCINQHCNRLGIYAITKGSEKVHFIPTDKLKAVQALTSAIYVLYDNDNAGIEGAPKFAATISNNCKAKVIDSELLYNAVSVECKDVCDVYASQGVEGVLRLVDVALNLHGELIADKTDKFSLSVENVIDCKFNQYLSEDLPFQMVTAAVVKFRKILIQAAAGTGKSYMNAALALWAVNNGYHSILFVAPTQTIAGQIYDTICKEFAKVNENESTNYTAALLIGNSKKSTIAAAYEATIVIAVYDQIKTKEYLFSELIAKVALLVVDETHQVVTDFGFRATPCRLVMLMLQRAANCILLSATPDYNFLHPAFKSYGLGFQLMRFFPTLTNQIDFNILVHESTKSVLLGEVDDRHRKGRRVDGRFFKGAHLVKLDNNKELKSYCDSVVNEGGTRPLHLTSKRTDDESSIAYKNIISNSGRGLKFDRLVYTSIFEAGASLAVAVGTVSLLDTKCHKKGIQLATRPRLQSDGTNSKIVVNLYFDAKTEPKKVVGDQYNRIAYLLKCAERNAAVLNRTLDDYTQVDDTENGGEFGVYQKGGIYYVDLVSILYDLYQMETSATTPELLKSRIERLDPRFNISIQYITTTTDKLRNLLNVAKVEKAAVVDGAKELLVGSTLEFMKSIIVNLKNKERKEQVLNILDIHAPRKFQQCDFIAEHAAIFENNFSTELFNNTITLLGVGYSLEDAAFKASELSTAEVDLIKQKISVKKDIKTFCKAIKNEDKKVNLSALSAEKTLIAILVKDKLNNIFKNAKRGKRQNKITAVQFAELVNDIALEHSELKRLKPYTKKTVIPFIKTIFDIEFRRTKKETFYTLVGAAKV
jgi:hypothetical protein